MLACSILQLTVALFDQKFIVCLAIRFNRGPKKGGLRNLKLEKHVRSLYDGSKTVLFSASGTNG